MEGYNSHLNLQLFVGYIILMMQVSIAKSCRNGLQIIGFYIPLSNTGYERLATYFCQEPNKKKEKNTHSNNYVIREGEKKRKSVSQ